MRTLLLTSLCFIAAAFSQVSGPTPGYVFDAENHELRPIRGAVGSAHLGAALVKDADAAAASPDGTLAIASRFGSLELIRGFDSDSPVRLTLAQEPGDVLFAWSGHDIAAVFPATRKAFLWRGVDTAADQFTPLDIAGIDGEIRAVLLDGARLAIAAKGGLHLAAAGETKRLAALDDPSAMLLAGADLFVADRAANAILQVHDYAATAATDKFADVAAPVGIQLTKGLLLAASAESRTVDAFDVATKARTGSVELDFQPTRLDSLGGQPLALLNHGVTGQPLYVLDSRADLQVLFVPAGREQ